MTKDYGCASFRLETYRTVGVDAVRILEPISLQRKNKETEQVRTVNTNSINQDHFLPTKNQLNERVNRHRKLVGSPVPNNRQHKLNVGKSHYIQEIHRYNRWLQAYHPTDLDGVPSA